MISHIPKGEVGKFVGNKSIALHKYSKNKILRRLFDSRRLRQYSQYEFWSFAESTDSHAVQSDFEARVR